MDDKPDTDTKPDVDVASSTTSLKADTDDHEDKDIAANMPVDSTETDAKASSEQTTNSHTRSASAVSTSSSSSKKRLSRGSVRKVEQKRESTAAASLLEEGTDGAVSNASITAKVADGQDQSEVNGAIEERQNGAPSDGSVSDGEMDEVKLEEDEHKNGPEDKASQPAESPPPVHAQPVTAVLTTSPTLSPPKLPPRDSSPSTRGFSSTFQNQFPPPPKGPQPTKTISSERLPPPPRKLTSPFAWLSRNASNDKKARSSSPPTKTASHARTDTVTSSITLGSMSTENSHEKKESLQDRFKVLRMQGEAMGEEGGDSTSLDISHSRSKSVTSMNGVSQLGTSENGSAQASGTKSPEFSAPRQTMSNINPRLPPGTAAGVETAPASTGPVDWDLWQNVVYEGPAAVARTSEGESRSAIAGGIPQAIRGVVWQVLADSKNDELERLYRELVMRGVSKSDGSVSKDKDSIASSASSTHSAQSSGTSADASQRANSQQVNIEAGSPINGVNGAMSEDLVTKLIHDAQSRTKTDDKAVEKLEKVIKRDMGARTSYSKYLMSAGLQDGLFGICKSYALFDETVGYAQGMNFIAMPLLFNMPEEEAFSLFVTLMHSPKYRLRTLFTPEMTGLHLMLHQFSRCLEDIDPVLYCHLHRRGVEPRLYATQWFLTLFAYRFPLQLVLRVYDFVLSEGLEAAMLRFGLTLLVKNREALLGMADMVQLTTFLKEKLFDAYIDKSPSASSLLESGFFGSAGGADKEVYKADVLVSDAVSIEIQENLLRTYEAEWTEQTQLEKERERELESLRASVVVLTSKVRRLEETSERSDQDHVAIASELVRTKVENESLKDENEGLKGQVEELRRVVHTQTEEVEKRLRGEMQSVMDRNVEIFGENRRLEDELGEMERVLVSTKLDFAQLNSEHDQLKQKWNNVAGLMKEHR